MAAPQLPKGRQEAAGEVRFLGTTHGPHFWEPWTPALGSRAQGHAGSGCSRQQRGTVAACREALLVPQCCCPNIVLWTLPAQGPHVRDFRRPGHNDLHFSGEAFPGRLGWGLSWTQAPCTAQGLLGRALAAARSTFPGPDRSWPPHCPPHSPLLKPREEKSETHFHFRAGVPIANTP